MLQRSPGITRLLGRLEARRLVRRARCPNDRRQVLCHATPRALELLAALDSPMTEAGRRCLAPLGAEQTGRRIDALDAVRAAAALAAPALASETYSFDKAPR